LLADWIVNITIQLLQEYHRRKRPHLCNQAVLLITDGVPEHYEEVFRKWIWNYPIKVSYGSCLIQER